MVGGEIPDEVRVGEGGGADHDPLHAGIEEGERGVPVANATTGLHRDGHGRRNGRNDVAVLRHAGAGRVEVDDVDPAAPASAKASAWATGSSP